MQITMTAIVKFGLVRIKHPKEDAIKRLPRSDPRSGRTDWQNEARETLRDEGLCVISGKHGPAETGGRCAACWTKKRASDKKHQEKNRLRRMTKLKGIRIKQGDPLFPVTQPQDRRAA